MPKKRQLLNQVFSFLTVVAESGRSNDGKVMWLCACSCGGICIVRNTDLTKQKQISCGCAKGESHGQTYTREYRSWGLMIQRCTNPKNPKYKSYGARGITVCGQWRNSFIAFFKAMGTCPIGYSLDRINNDLGYFPGNCRWASRSLQGINKRTKAHTQTEIKGVYLNKRTQKYVASIKKDQKVYFLGSFKDLASAVVARKAAEERLYPELQQNRR